MLDHYSTSSAKASPLIQIHVKHLYYADQSAKKMWDYIITPHSQQFMKRIGLSLQNTQESLNIWADSDKKEAFQQLLASDEEVSISIMLYPRPGFWLSFTEIPYPKSGVSGLLYFNNQSSHSPYLSKASMVSHQDFLDATPAAPTALPEGSSSNTSAFPTTTNHAKQALELHKNTIQKNIDEYLKGLINQGYNPPAAWIHLHFDHHIKKQWFEDLAQGRQARMLNYQLIFQARKAFWRYWLVLNNRRDRERIHQIELINDLADISFLGPEMYEIGQESWAYVFVSQKPLAILERPFMKFQAKVTYKIPEELDYEGKRYQQEFVKLPYPQLKHIHQDRKTPQEVFMLMSKFTYDLLA